MQKKRSASLLLEGIIALSLVFTVGFALSESLLQARKLLKHGQDSALALEVLETALAKAHLDPQTSKGLTRVAKTAYEWKALRRKQTGLEEIEVTVFWRDDKNRPQQVSNLRCYRVAEVGP